MGLGAARFHNRASRRAFTSAPRKFEGDPWPTSPWTMRSKIRLMDARGCSSMSAFTLKWPVAIRGGRIGVTDGSTRGSPNCSTTLRAFWTPRAKSCVQRPRSSQTQRAPPHSRSHISQCPSHRRTHGRPEESSYLTMRVYLSTASARNQSSLSDPMGQPLSSQSWYATVEISFSVGLAIFRMACHTVFL
jgi:hypothetical protein